MAKDYAKKTKKRNSASRFDNEIPSKTIPAWIWLIVGLSSGLVISYTVYYQLLKPKAAPVISAKKEVPSAKSRYQAVPAEESPDSDFSYHNALESKVVEVPDQNSIQTSKNATIKTYVMQCGSFQNSTSAESLKARIAMNGFTANINATKENSGELWYRVTLGPYESKRTAERERHQLERNDINHCQIW